MSEFNDLNLTEMIALAQGMLHQRGAEFKADVIKPVIQALSVPQVARAHEWTGTKKAYNKTLTVNDAVYELPYDFCKFFYLKNKYGPMKELSEEDFDATFPDRSSRTSNRPQVFTVRKCQGVHTQPASAETITITSSSTADGSQVALVRGEVSGVDDYEEVTLNASGIGVTTKSFTDILYIGKQGVSTGVYTITGTTSGTELGKISPEHRTSKYQSLELDSKPTEALALVGSYLSTAFRPQRDYDVFRIPADLVLLNTLNLLLMERREPTQVAQMDKKYEKELSKAIKNDLKSFTIESGLTLGGTGEAIIPNDHPLRYM